VTRDPRETLFADLDAELNRERAAALGRAARKLEAQLRRCSELQGRIETMPAGDTSALTRQYREAREESERLRWNFHVQREALRLYDHRWVDRIYPRPPAM
jgi:hypothetical protein